jgi:hypothetical protein
MPNNTRKAERRAKLAANKAARNAAGVNMFTPLNGSVPLVRVKSVELGSSPLGANAAYYTTPLRAANLFNGKPFRGELSPEEQRRMFVTGLPTSYGSRNGDILSQEDLNAARAIAAENAVNTRASKSASTANAMGVTGNRYLYPKSYENKLAEFLHRPAVLSATRQSEGVEGHNGYTVADPTAKSIENAKAYHKFAEQIHAKQLKPDAPGLFSSCFGGSCSAVEPSSTVTIRNPLSSSRGGRSRRYYRKMRKSRNKRRHRTVKYRN